jgi:LysM repeat protein
VALAAVVVAVYAAVFSTSLFSLVGVDGTPDLLRLRDDNEQPEQVAEVLGVQEDKGPVVLIPPTPAANQPTRLPVFTQPATNPPSTTTQPAQPSTPPASVSGTHMVRSGDTLSQLSLTYRIDVASLKLINGLDSDVIYAGQTLVVPRPDEASRLFVPSLGEAGVAGD